MAMSLNKAMLIGNLTRDPETRTTGSGQTVSNFGLATSRSWKDQSGQLQERTEFHNIVAWGRLAELCGQYLSKGRKVWVEGYLQTRDWVGEDGAKHYKTEIIAENIIFLDRPPSSAGATPLNAPIPTPVASPVAPEAGKTDPFGTMPREEITVESIPF